MNNLGNFIVIYYIISIAISAIVLIIPPVRRLYFRLFARLEAEAIEVMSPIMEKVFEKFE